jgi:hypothetical protein
MVIFQLRKCGEEHHCVLCGLFGESEMQDVLKINKGQWKSSTSCLFKHCSIRPMHVVCLRLPPCLNFYFYVPLFAFSGGISLYTSYILGLHPFTLFNELLIYQKIYIFRMSFLLNIL